ncbi:MAG: tRNA (5-methylaminomethyl-2-thiouridine)(34)-methyltransferase MnmD [Flavobacteriales bacterium]|nr:tRNA (5-methylaminomethyl-2-thiouridine)(34)-methyltransferase MnmD [Flavobacteriales bacterium]
MINKKSHLKVILTEDKSATIYNEDLDETYHSKYGALSESLHIYIKNGLHKCPKQSINILEVGYGTGLNAALTFAEAQSSPKEIYYTGVENCILQPNVLRTFCDSFSPDISKQILSLDRLKWGKEHYLNKWFTLIKLNIDIQYFNTNKNFDIIYFDAFGPDKQPEIWSRDILQKMAEFLNSGGFMVTYCSKGTVKRDLKNAGLKILNLPGPPGKREITLAYKD